MARPVADDWDGRGRTRDVAGEADDAEHLEWLDPDGLGDDRGAEQLEWRDPAGLPPM